MDQPEDMFLTKLREGCPALTSAVGESMAEAASVCLEQCGHQIAVNLQVTRVKQKIEQTTRSDATRLPSYVAVLEYSQPVVHLVKRVVKT